MSQTTFFRYLGGCTQMRGGPHTYPEGSGSPRNHPMKTHTAKKSSRTAPWPWVATALAAAITFVTACAPAPLGPGYPLYPDPQSRLPDDRVARLVGPIGSVDGKEVSAQGDGFDLLPGCHIVQLHGDMARSNGNFYWVGPVPRFIFALRMKAGHRYILRREFVQDMSSTTGSIVALAREEDSAGA